MKNKAKKMGFAVLTSAAMLTTVLTANAQSSKVFIDPGHGGFDNGSSYLGNLEDELNLQIANKVAKKLKNRGISVNMSRTNDTYVGLGQRALMSNSSDANVFISIHQNASENSNVSGIETYYLKDSGINLAKSIHSKVIGYTGASNRKIRKANFQVLRENNVTAILIECGFISNKYEGYNLSTDAYQEKIANGIVEGVVDYLNNNKVST